MEVLLIKEQLHNVVDSGNEELLNLIFALVTAYNNEQENEFTEDKLNEFKRRRESHLNGTSKSYSWSEAKSIITKGKN
jgi:hypothetical protein